MATVTSLGAGSGLELEALVTNLMAVERQPLSSLQKQVSSYNSKISALGTLSSKLNSLQTAAKALVPNVLQSPLQKFASYSASLGDTNIGTVTATTGAVAGSYNLNVTHLAQAQKVTSGVLPSTLNTGTLTIDFGSVSGGAFTADPDRQATINITTETNTPEGLRNAINQANIGVSATIVNGTNGPQLVLTGSEGGDKAFKLSGISGLTYDPGPKTGDFSNNQEAQNAAFTVDGIAATSNSNTVTGVIDGVTLNLAKTGSTTLTVKQDNTTNLKSALEGFVSAYNSAVTSMTSLGAYNSETKVAGALQGNRILREAQNTLSNLVFNTSSTTDGVTQKLSDIGISIKGTDGTLSLDSAKLEAALTKNPNAVANLVAKVGDSFSDSIDRIIGLGGSIDISKTSMKSSIKFLEDRQEALELRLVSIEARYRKQFSSLDTLVSTMNTTSTYLTNQLASLNSSKSK